jgi:translation initiation factor IF-1
MSKQINIEAEGLVIESLGNSIFRVQLDAGHIILCHLSGKIRMNSIHILVGDRVRVQMSPYDMTKGRITLRLSKIAKLEN